MSGGFPWTIVRLTPDEGPRLRAIRLRALHDAPDAFGTRLEDEIERTVESWSHALADLPTFVAVEQGSDVGMVRAGYDARRADTAWLISMWVAPDHRRRGVGAALVEVVVAWADANRIPRLLLEVADTNAAAIGLYDRMGFRPNGEVGRLPPPRQHVTEHQRELRI
jgi:ribosomal protein S18 acetylase RimI-like enzyme